MRSPLTFSCQQLEREYQDYQARQVRRLAWCLAVSLVAFFGMIYMDAYGKGARYRHMLPPQTLPLLFCCLPGLAIAATTLFPGFHASHHQAVHALYYFLLCFSYHHVRQNFLWLGLLDAKPHTAFLAQATCFAKENLYLTVTWFAVVLFPMGQSLGRLTVLGLLVVNLAGNSAICASPLWPPDSATMSAAPLGAANALSSGLLQIVQPFYHTRNGSLTSCPEVLAVWQALGSLLAMLAMGGAEIVRRWAFLHTLEVQASLGRGNAARALHWPWGGMFLSSNLVASAIGLIVVHALLWALLTSIIR